MRVGFSGEVMACSFTTSYGMSDHWCYVVFSYYSVLWKILSSFTHYCKLAASLPCPLLGPTLLEWVQQFHIISLPFPSSGNNMLPFSAWILQERQGTLEKPASGTRWIPSIRRASKKLKLLLSPYSSLSTSPSLTWICVPCDTHHVRVLLF